MSARNIYHDVVVTALIADGWTITDDPLRLTFGGRNLYVDLGAERGVIAATKDKQRIAVEVQSFLNPSQTNDLHAAVGQFGVYRTILTKKDSERLLYLAVPEPVYDELFADQFGQLIISDMELRLMVFDQNNARVIRWIS